MLTTKDATKGYDIDYLVCLLCLDRFNFKKFQTYFYEFLLQTYRVKASTLFPDLKHSRLFLTDGITWRGLKQSWTDSETVHIIKPLLD
ncbi:hypothetical protein [Nostoc sp. FACHB-892]|uniref:hypothetical protein n=1 Tax=Nostoc sp. FACHB-892 TaxID=2692843 RepID=UPI0016859252|nr:hypothetical protein [Nostoc sp. FACHB-892]